MKSGTRDESRRLSLQHDIWSQEVRIFYGNWGVVFQNFKKLSRKFQETIKKISRHNLKISGAKLMQSLHKLGWGTISIYLALNSCKAYTSWDKLSFLVCDTDYLWVQFNLDGMAYVGTTIHFLTIYLHSKMIVFYEPTYRNYNNCISFKTIFIDICF